MTNEQQPLDPNQEAPEFSGFTQEAIDQVRNYPGVKYFLERGAVEVVSKYGVTLLPDSSDSVRPLEPETGT